MQLLTLCIFLCFNFDWNALDVQTYTYTYINGVVLYAQMVSYWVWYHELKRKREKKEENRNNVTNNVTALYLPIFFTS